MRSRYLRLGSFVLVLGVIFLFFPRNPAFSSTTPVSPFQSASLADPSPAVFSFNSSVAYYANHLIYAGEDGNIHAYNLNTSTSTKVADLSGDPSFSFGPSGFFVSNDHFLYFTDNGNTTNIYRLLLTGSWPTGFTSLATGSSGPIFAFTQNPWTDAIWFASADFFGAGDELYLYEVNAAFTNATLRASFTHRASGGNGPIIFKGPTTLLYGESVFGGNGYFHLLNSGTGVMIQKDYLTFTGGLADVAYGYDNVIYVTTGAGKAIYEIQGTRKIQIATTDHEAQGITFDGTSLYLSEMVPFSGGPNDGEISFHLLWISSHARPFLLPANMASSIYLLLLN